tara:strand:- start:428 stop:1225 length:798 start_codon:yes stop_codon:yes gene_type:complete
VFDESELYRQMSAVNSSDFNTCFYCGCIATQYDLAPPLKYAEFYLKTREDADFYQVPSCQECFDFLKGEKSGLLAQRVDRVKEKLTRKYHKAIRIYEMWNHDELEELDYHLKKSVNAGLELGEESYDRIKYKGFASEVDGEKHSSFYVQDRKFEVFGERFDSFRDALDYGSKAFRIPKAKLRDLYLDHQNSFDEAIRSFQAELDRKLYEKELKQKCKIFADKHKQNVKFVMHTVEIYRKKNETLTIETALEKLFEERIKKNNQNL